MLNEWKSVYMYVLGKPNVLMNECEWGKMT